MEGIGGQRVEPPDSPNGIEEIDRQLVSLLNRRVELTRELMPANPSDAQKPGDRPSFDPVLEARILESVAGLNQGPLARESLAAIYREILSASRSLDRSLRVGYLGPVATFAYEATLQQFGAAATLVPCRTIGDVFVETQRRAVDYGVVPAENSTEGAVTNTLDRFLENDLLICGEIKLPVSHNLLSTGSLEQITQVYSHPQALAQCRRWLAENLPRATQIETASTAKAAQVARTPDTAAISTAAAAQIYELPIVARRIEDNATNVTRFLVIGDHMSAPSGRDRTAIVFAVDDRAGALCAALSSLAENGINLNRIESRPSRRRLWEYVFFVDLDGHPTDEVVTRAMAALTSRCSFLRVLGCWPV
jgi:chorismate mutase/prephenate dehydratase